MSGLDGYGVDNTLDIPSTTTDYGANIIASVKFKDLWDWSKSVCSLLSAGLNAATVDVRLQPLYKLRRHLSRFSVAWKKFRKRHQELVGVVGSNSEGEGQVECGGSTSGGDIGALRLHMHL